MTQLEQLTPTTEIPHEILYRYPIEIERTQLLGGGLVNYTYLVEGAGKKVIVQKLGDVIQPELIADADVYSRHLDKDGWDAPMLQRTKTNDNFCEDESGNKWRALHFVESDASTPAELNDDMLQRMGSMLARWHRSMSWLDYKPTYSIPYFHDTEYHAKKLLETKDDLPSSESISTAYEILDTYTQLPPLPESPSQLIHGDPKLDNILFRDGKPLTFIDFDTVMEGPIWLDIGDMLRSILKNDISAGRPLDRAKIDSVTEGYFDAARPGIRFADFVANAILATKHITLELAMRYLNDIYENYYFSWDPGLYNSRHDNHLDRAQLQWQLFLNLDN